MITFLLVGNNGTIKQTKAQETSFEFLYKKCGFRSENNFDKRTTWKVNMNGDKHIIELWAKDNGKANNENKYDFPPPVDKELYFGACMLIRRDEDGNVINLDALLWAKIYEKLFGGFEDIGNEDEEEYSEDELENVDKKLKTKHGYLKDGFVIDSAAVSDEDNGGGNEDDEDDEDDDDDDDEEEHEMNDFEEVEEDEDEDDDCSFDNVSDELEESEYDYSDDDE